MTQRTQSLIQLALPYAVLAAITLIAFSPVLTHDFIRYDDTVYITDNPGVKQGLSLAGLRYAATKIVSSNWHPLTILSHQLDVTLFGLRAPGHHAVNLVFHITNAYLLFRLLRKMTGQTKRCLLIAALFAVHPLHVESVAWVSERKDVLSTFCMFMALGAYVNFSKRRRAGSYASMLVWYALALLAKPMPVTMPFLLLLLDYWPLRNPGDPVRQYARLFPRLAVEKLPLFALSAASCIVTYVVQQRTGATRDLDAVSLGHRIETAAVAYAGYLAKMIAPVHLAPHYPLSSPASITLLASVALLIAITITALALVRARPYLAVGWFWYLGTLVPVIGLIQIGNQAMADRYTYVPLIGIFITIVWAAADMLSTNRSRRAVTVTAIVVLATLSMMAFKQARYWKDSETLFIHTLAVSPRSAVAHTVLGLVYAKDKKHDQALTHFQRAQELDPRPRDAAFNLGTALLNANRPSDAIPWLTAATTAYDKPADARANLGMALLQLNFAQNAMAEFAKALAIDENHIPARMNLGIAAGMLGDTATAIATLAEVVRRAPNDADAHYNYGIALLNGGRTADAITHFEEALRLRPGFAEAKTSLDQLFGVRPR
ncbi:MAG: tetratricopeptide repeat protein [Candidatus Hydrogenedentes bacterium]|nr:tetratricopeptide repeat protein [Candidatus Hydrogenedentota bacterium]